MNVNAGMLRISKEYHLSSSHHLPTHKGKCRRVHGHNYVIIVTVEGEVVKDFHSSSYGMVLDFDDLDQIMDPLIESIDHYNLNEFFTPSTAEQITSDIGDHVHRALETKDCNVYSVQVFETPKASATWINT